MFGVLFGFRITLLNNSWCHFWKNVNYMYIWALIGRISTARPVTLLPERLSTCAAREQQEENNRWLGEHRCQNFFVAWTWSVLLESWFLRLLVGNVFITAIILAPTYELNTLRVLTIVKVERTTQEHYNTRATTLWHTLLSRTMQSTDVNLCNVYLRAITIFEYN